MVHGCFRAESDASQTADTKFFVYPIYAVSIPGDGLNGTDAFAGTALTTDCDGDIFGSDSDGRLLPAYFLEVEIGTGFFALVALGTQAFFFS